ncbi:MAG: riboflavin biosynthesis protein RibF, partial [Candidatus Electrothrix sp. AUS4]|nr:riboflavin biosynthesis protein RibF [Candidatus Electrothrix sp. AUS4]
KSNSIQELSVQIRQDVATAKQVLADAAKEHVLSCEERFNTLKT